MNIRKNLFYLILSVGVFSWLTTVSAVDIDTQIEDALNEKEEQEIVQKAQDLNEKITFTKVNSCESMEKVLSDFLETYKKLHPKINYDRRYYKGGWGNIYYETESLDFAVADSINWSQSLAVNEVNAYGSASKDMWKLSDYSTTNIQKIWVDEPEILKSNWKYLFYYSLVDYDDKYISIIKTPTKDDLSDAEIVSKITIPDSLDNIQLFLNGNKLIIIWSRYTSNFDSILWASRSLVIIYDISDLDNLKLEKMTEVYGSFNDARMIWNQLYLITSINLSWYNIVRRDDPVVFNDMKPKLIDVTLQNSSNWKNTYTKKVVSMPCDSIFYLLPSEETMKETDSYPSFTLISQISLSDVGATPKQDLVFGNVNEIHMSQTSLYLPAPIYFSSPVKCSLRWCYGSWYYRNENTLVHKFNLWKTLSYQDSTIIPWTPLNQYSMDEDNDGNFRILTTTWYNQNATHLSILDNDLELKWSLLNIEPGENFKSSRYIWDKLYLVTYQNIDPLFVVDMEDITNPKIIWELKIPGYSTYLHPYSDAKNWVQYLIWLWYSTTDNWYGGLKQDNTKVDLYKIDYNWHETAETKCSSLITRNVDAELTDSCTKVSTGEIRVKKCNEEQRLYEDCLTKVNPENIAVSVIASYEFTWDTSYTPALDNPRVFVWRSNKQELVLPMNIRNTIEKWTYENNWKYRYDTFMGLKWLSIKTSTALIKEVLSQNFVDGSNDKNYRDFNNARVWYIDDVYYFLNKWFAWFLDKDGNIAAIGSF